MYKQYRCHGDYRGAGHNDEFELDSDAYTQQCARRNVRQSASRSRFGHGDCFDSGSYDVGG